MNHANLDGRGEHEHWELDNALDSGLIHTSATLGGNVTLATGSLDLTTWQTVTGMSVTFTPKRTGTVLIIGQAGVSQGTAGTYVAAGILNGSTVIAQSRMCGVSTFTESVPLVGVMAVTKDTSYTLDMKAKSSSDATDITVAGGGYTQYAVVQLRT